MSQATITMNANQTGTAFTAELSDALDAVDTNHSGSTAPTLDIAAGKMWLDTSGVSPILKIYNSGWKALFTVGSSNVQTTLNTGTFANLNGTTSALGAMSGSTLTATGAITGASISVGTGNLTAGASGLGAVTATSLSSGTTLNVTGTSTLAGVNATSLTSTGAISGTTLTTNGVSTLVGNVNVTGAIVATQNITAYSDERLKEDIKNIPDALAKVCSIRGVTYERNDVITSRQTGVIAQELEAVLPEAVVTSEEGMKSVAYGNMVGLLIEAIKEQQVQIDGLKKLLEK
jgi:hypothetical protein